MNNQQKQCEADKALELSIALVGQVLLTVVGWWLILYAPYADTNQYTTDFWTHRQEHYEALIIMFWPLVACPCCIPAYERLSTRSSRPASALDIMLWLGCFAVISPQVFCIANWTFHTYLIGGLGLIWSSGNETLLISAILPLGLLVEAVGILGRSNNHPQQHTMAKQPREHVQPADMVCTLCVACMLLGVCAIIYQWASWMDETRVTPVSVTGVWMVGLGLAGLAAQQIVKTIAALAYKLTHAAHRRPRRPGLAQ